MSETFFVKQQKKDRYTILDKTCIEDPRLSWKAKGLHTYLMSLPDDWKIYLSEIVKHSTDGIDSLYSAIKQLETYGYIKKAKIRRDDGCFGGTSYYVYEKPEVQPDRENPDVDNPDTEKPRVENPTLLNTNILNTNLNKTELTNCDPLEVSQSVSFTDLVKSIFDGEYPFDKNFESDVQRRFSKWNCDACYLESFLKYVFERTKLVKPTKSFHGLYRTLALSTSVMGDFNRMITYRAFDSKKSENRKIIYADCPACKTRFDELEYYCPTCQLKLDSIKNGDETEIQIHKALFEMPEDEKEKHNAMLEARTKSTGRFFLTAEERLQFYREYGILQNKEN